MTTFHFRLATLLRLREIARDERRVELADSQRLDAALESQLAQLAVEQKLLQDDCRRAGGPGTVNVSQLAVTQQYAATLRGQEAELQERRRTLAAEIDQRRQAAIEADRDVKSLEKLRESQLRAFRQNEDRQEGKLLDEAALQTADVCGAAAE